MKRMIRAGTPGTWILIGVVGLHASVASGGGGADRWLDLWWTRDQRAERALAAGDAREAARLFTDPLRVGVAWYRAGEFDRAARAFGRSDRPEAHYNRGNALVLLGDYDGAIAAYEKALAMRPDWVEANQNRGLAMLRKQRLVRREDDAGGTYGKLAADDFVLDLRNGSRSTVGRQIVEGGEGVPNAVDSAFRALWLRRVQTRPADFLAARFAWQLQSREETE
jgi:Ca-activated chloride channel family protein